ncbi:MAG: cell division protein SepF [Suipraeoptans sp.]
MGVLDKFLDIIKMTDDDDYEDDFYDDEFADDEFEEEKPKKRTFNKSKNKSRNDDYDDDIEQESKSSGNSGTNVTPIRPARRSGKNMEVCVIKPSVVDDQREIAETLLSGRTVILNLEGLDLEIAQRIIDFTSGTTFAIGGNLQKVSNFIFLVTPNNVEISGDLQDLLNTSFENSSVRTRY